MKIPDSGQHICPNCGAKKWGYLGDKPCDCDAPILFFPDSDWNSHNN